MSDDWLVQNFTAKSKTGYRQEFCAAFSDVFPFSEYSLFYSIDNTILYNKRLMQIDQMAEGQVAMTHIDHQGANA